VIKKQHRTKEFTERIELMRETIKEGENGQITYTYEGLGHSWCNVNIITKNPTENVIKPNVTEGLSPLFVYLISMRKYFNSDARHAYINTLRFKHKLLTIVVPFHRGQKENLYQCYAADLNRECCDG
jgi:hypothetical protein